MDNCACGSGKTYLDCCNPFITGLKIPTTPEALMRSRYTAYTQANIDYITKTMKAPANQDFDPVAAAQWAKSVRWLALEVVKATSTDTSSFVEFIAHYSHENKRYVLHEISEFHLENGQWYYVNGKGPDAKSQSIKIGRNDPCPCASQKKFKHCCGGL